jgi:hypothetical protein
MARNRKPPLDERLRRYGLAQDVSRGLSRGIDHLPVGDLTKMALKMKSGEAVAVIAETSAAVATAATVAAREGVEAFQQQRASQQTTGQPGATATDGVKHATSTPPKSFPWQKPADRPTSWPDDPGNPDLAARLERLRDLHAAGHLTDDEYARAKAKVLGLDD